MKLKTIAIISLAVLFLVAAGYILLNLTVYKIKDFDRAVLLNNGETVHLTDNYLKTESVISVKPIHSGDLKVMLSNPMNLEHPAFNGVKDFETTVPIFAYLIHHETYGYFLIDSGCAGSYKDMPYGPMSGLLLSHFVPETLLDAQDAIENQLSDLRDDIKGIFFTHLHPDHTSGLSALPSHILYFAGKGEQSFNIKWLLETNHFTRDDTVYLFDFSCDDAIDMPVGKAIDIFGDQSIWAISTPGHSKGHVSYLVNTPDHPVLVAGDACIANDSLKYGVRSGTSSGDKDKDQATVEKIKAFADNHPEIGVWAGHDFPSGFNKSSLK